MIEFLKIFIRILRAVPLTLVLNLSIMVISLILGFFISLALQHRIPLLSQLLKLFIAVFRGSPLLVQLFIVYYSMPGWVCAWMNRLGIPWQKGDLNPISVIIVSFSLYYAAYQQETLRAAFYSVEDDQKELAESLGYTEWQKIFRVILPQAMVYILPGILNTFLSVMKALSVAFTISVVDIFAMAKLESSLNGNYLLTFAAAALIYWLICILFTRLIRALEERRPEQHSTN